MKAKLLSQFTIIEWDGHTDSVKTMDEDLIFNFESGYIVEVLKCVGENDYGKLFVVYSEDLKESTIVAESILEFI